MDQQQYPVVMRMEGMFPTSIGGYEGHRTRKGGDVGHVDKERSHLNRRLIGSEDWAAEVLSELDEMKTDNFTRELEQLKKRRRKNDLKLRAVEGPKDPWRATRQGPMREIILTANKKWFEEGGECRIDRFQELSLGWLKEHFGEDLVHARADLDEEVYHIHAVIFPRATTRDGRKVLQPSKHPMIKDYEAAQDSVGLWFAELGLTRGEQRKAEIRKAVQHNAKQRNEEDKVPVPPGRWHVSPSAWRKQQEVKLAEREKRLTQRAADIDAREQAVAAREQAVADAEEAVSEREKKLAKDRKRLEKRDETANAILTVASRIKDDGATALEGAPTTPKDRKSKLAARIFGPALARLRSDANAEAEAAVAEERQRLNKIARRLKKAAEEVEAAHDALRAILNKLPTSLRVSLKNPTEKFIANAIALKRLLASPDGRSAKRPDDEL